MLTVRLWCFILFHCYRKKKKLSVNKKVTEACERARVLLTARLIERSTKQIRSSSVRGALKESREEEGGCCRLQSLKENVN